MKTYKLLEYLRDKSNWVHIKRPTFAKMVEDLGYSGNKGLLYSLRRLQDEGLLDDNYFPTDGYKEEGVELDVSGTSSN